MGRGKITTHNYTDVMTEEFIEPTREGRRKFVVLLACLIAFGTALHFLFVPRFLAFLESLPPCDQLPWLERSLLVMLLLPVSLALFWAIPHARRLLKFQRSPLPNAWVLLRTPIRRGTRVRWQAYALLAWSALVIIVSVWGWYKLGDVFAALTPQACKSIVASPADHLGGRPQRAAASVLKIRMKTYGEVS